MKFWNDIKNHIKTEKWDLILGVGAGAFGWFLIKNNQGFGFLPYSIISDSQGVLNYVITTSTTALVEYKVLIAMIIMGIIIFDILNIGNFAVKLLRGKL